MFEPFPGHPVKQSHNTGDIVKYIQKCENTNIDKI